jgi:hypothetical protein
MKHVGIMGIIAESVREQCMKRRKHVREIPGVCQMCWVQGRIMMSYFVGILRREAGTLGASDTSSCLCVVSANLWPRTSVKIVNNNAERFTLYEHQSTRSTFESLHLRRSPLYCKYIYCRAPRWDDRTPRRSHSTRRPVRNIGRV